MTTPSERVRVHRKPERGAYDRATIDPILDEAFVAHVGIATDAGPVVVPMAMVRVGDRLYLHGSPASRLLRTLAKGAEVCVTVTLVDGVVLARSHFHHSLNYRSVVVVGPAVEVTDLDERRRALARLVERLQPGRSDDARRPSEEELRATRVVAVGLAEASAKVRTGPPVEEPEDMALPVWAGEVPLAVVRGGPVRDLACREPLPEYLEVPRAR